MFFQRQKWRMLLNIQLQGWHPSKIPASQAKKAKQEHESDRQSRSARVRFGGCAESLERVHTPCSSAICSWWESFYGCIRGFDESHPALWCRRVASVDAIDLCDHVVHVAKCRWWREATHHTPNDIVQTSRWAILGGTPSRILATFIAWWTLFLL
jgi:hypothetical protein